jgi:hypothetical protein
MGHKYVGALSYADDLTLMSPSIHGLQQMLQLVESFSEEYGLKLNAKKTQTICFTSKGCKQRIGDIPKVSVCGTEISWSQSVKHLGNIITADLQEKVDVQAKQDKLITKTNILMANYSRLTASTRQKIFTTYCSDHYGSQTWNLTDRAVQAYCTAYNKCLRKVWHLPGHSRTTLLYQLCNSLPMPMQLACRISKMYFQMMTSKNDTMRLLINRSLNDPKSICSANISHIERLTNLNLKKYSSFQDFKKDITQFVCQSVSGEDVGRANAVRELSNCIYHMFILDGFNLNDINDLIQEISVFR